ncbi:phosphoacetylglucosamine mutase [Prorops nasuta]|uniref:phosphoacetylglucosamine mutase n=1 Tax=Prorops nasuta TaxID=863751 RepID=UPI0034CE86C5
MNPSEIESIQNSQYKRLNIDRIEYGTAGFRARSEVLEHVFYRMGLLAVLRSKLKNANIGLMITASHNPESDNGIKLVDPHGEMLEISWEGIATDLANINDEGLISLLWQIINDNGIEMSMPVTIIIGRDTRKSSPLLLNAAISGIKALSGNVKDFGIITTPQLHYLVATTNTNADKSFSSLESYYKKLGNGFKRIRGETQYSNKYKANLYVDAANGVGANALKDIQKYIDSVLTINVFNDGNGELNYNCGADFVKTRSKLPLNSSNKPYVRLASIDGDADRLVYFYVDDQNKFHLMDGDRIATLAAVYLKELLEESNLSLKLGIVQTAYANGASTNYILNVLKIPVACVPTGVKHLHAKATEYDIGIYFEANGHGTVLFKDTAIKLIQESLTNTQLSTSEKTAISKIMDLVDMINQTVGDAISDILLVETILRTKDWSIVEWEQSYTDLPNKLLKVNVKDRNVVTVTDANRRCVTPKGLQEKINETIARYEKGRAFVRSSGTEDVIRVYVECESPSDVDKFALEVANLVYNFANGIGPRPESL